MLYGDIMKSVRRTLGHWGCEDDFFKYVDVKYPYINGYKSDFKPVQKLSDEFFKTDDFR